MTIQRSEEGKEELLPEALDTKIWYYPQGDKSYDGKGNILTNATEINSLESQEGAEHTSETQDILENTETPPIEIVEEAALLEHEVSLTDFSLPRTHTSSEPLIPETALLFPPTAYLPV